MDHSSRVEGGSEGAEPMTAGGQPTAASLAESEAETRKRLRRERIACLLRSFRTSRQELGRSRSSRKRSSGMLQEEVAILAGVSPATYKALENGRANPTLDVLDDVSAALGVGLGDLLAATEPSLRSP